MILQRGSFRGSHCHAPRHIPAMRCQHGPDSILVQQPDLPDDLALAAIRVVLVGPKTEGNIGAAARACGNFEASQLWVVAPRCDPRGGDVGRVACGTAITDRMTVVNSLEDALADTTGSIGFTRRAGATRYTHACLGVLLQQFPDALPPLLKSPAQPGASASSVTSLASPPMGITALVFGREESGLTEQELRLVSHACAIPSGRIQPSLNLSHAVSVVLSEAADEGKDRGPSARPFWSQGTDQVLLESPGEPGLAKYASAGEVEVLLKKLAVIAESAGVSAAERTSGEAHSQRKLALGHARALLGRAKVTCSEARSLHGLASSVIAVLSPDHPLGPKKSPRGQTDQGSPLV